MQTLGQRIAKVREARGWTQEVVAKLLNISPTAYAKIERNETDVHFSRLEEIAKALQVDLWAFFTPQNPIMIIGDVNEKTQISGTNNTQHNYPFDFEKERQALHAHIDTLKQEDLQKQTIIDKLLR